MKESNPASSVALRLVGLDTLRGLCALAVVLGHINLPDSGGGRIESALRFLYSIFSNGPAAVMIFFVISGLCIHLPQAGGRDLHVPTFYSRRGLRIGVPMGVAWLISWWAGCLPEFDGVLWSLICEIIYYALYPVLLWLSRKWGWNAVLFSSALAALVVLASDPSLSEYPSFGVSRTWILGLPIWILGCMLAERLRNHAGPVNGLQLWMSRSLVFGASAAAVILRWKLGSHSIGYPWTMTAFGLVSWWWLGIELRHLRSLPPPRWLDIIGAASYSLYLSHVLVIHLGWGLLGAYGSTLWFRALLVAASLIAAGLFYLAVERPSHRIATGINLRRSPKTLA